MGRTIPAPRPVIEAEIRRLMRVASALKDPEDREIAKKLLKCASRVADAYRFVPLSDPLEAVLIGAMICLARECMWKDTS